MMVPNKLTPPSFQGPPHRKTFSWALKLGEHESVGTAASKKIAKALAATQGRNSTD